METTIIDIYGNNMFLSVEYLLMCHKKSWRFIE